jgi:hypothetical protein
MDENGKSVLAVGRFVPASIPLRSRFDSVVLLDTKPYAIALPHKGGGARRAGGTALPHAGARSVHCNYTDGMTFSAGNQVPSSVGGHGTDITASNTK